MRKLIKAGLLTLVLTVPAWAGHIGQPIAPPPDGRQAQGNTDSAKTGDIGCPLAGTEITVRLLQTLLALI